MFAFGAIFLPTILVKHAFDLKMANISVKFFPLQHTQIKTFLGT